MGGNLKTWGKLDIMMPNQQYEKLKPKERRKYYRRWAKKYGNTKFFDDFLDYRSDPLHELSNQLSSVLTGTESQARKQNEEFDKAYLHDYSKSHRRKKKEAPHRSCSYCHKSGRDVQLTYCKGCRIAFYCNPQCQRSHWKEHKKACRQAQKENPRLGIFD